MRSVTKPKAKVALPDGWLVKAHQGYYTGNQRSVLECWTAFPHFAKVYQRQRWAQTMAARLGGHAVPTPTLDTSQATRA